MRKHASVLAVIGVLLVGGCADQPPGPAALQLSSSGVQPPTSSGPVALATADPSPVSDDQTLTSTGSDDPVEAPRSTQLVAAPGGSILLESPAELAVRKRERDAMLKQVDPPRLDFTTTGSTPRAQSAKPIMPVSPPCDAATPGCASGR